MRNIYLELVLKKQVKISYKIRNSLYLNITNRCSNTCIFCARYNSDFVRGHNLRLKREPTIEDIMNEVKNPNDYDEIVYCGYGEPLIRLNLILESAKIFKAKGIRLRINTNGHGNMIHNRNIVPELARYIDTISISLNTDTG